MVRASSTEMAITLTPVSFAHCAYKSFIASSSAIQGLHHVAQKSIMMGLPPFENEDVLKFEPSSFLTWIAGTFEFLTPCANTVTEANNSRETKSLFIQGSIKIYWVSVKQ